MKLASIQGMSLETVLREATGRFAPSFDTQRAELESEPEPHVTDFIDDSYSEAVNFRFEARGCGHRGLVTYEALRELTHADDADELATREPALALCIRHADEIGATAMEKFARDGVEPVVLAEGDL